MMRYRLSRRFFRKWALVLLLGTLLITGASAFVYFNSLLPTGRISDVIVQKESVNRSIDNTLRALKSISSDAPQRIDLLAEFALEIGQLRDLDTQLEALQASVFPLPIFIVGVALFGILMMTMILYAIEYRDGTYRTLRQLEQSLEVDALAALPPIRGAPGKDKLINSADAYAPAYKALAMKLMPPDDQRARAVLLTSVDNDEGKSLTAANLGLAFASYNCKVLIIDADLRSPAQHRLFKLSNREGLANLVYGYSVAMEDQIQPLIDAYIKSSEVEGVSILTTGPLPAQPQDLLGLAKLPSLLDALKAHFDILILDTPALLTTPDALPLLEGVDGVLLLIDSRRTRRRAAKQTVHILHQQGAKIFGTVLNRATGNAVRGDSKA